MSEAAPISRDEAILARLAELGLGAAEKAHGKFMAAEETAEFTEVGRTYDRMARSLRQTLALKHKLTREVAQDARRAEMMRPREHAPYVDPDQEAIDARVADLQAAGKQLLWSYFGRNSHRIDRIERLERELDDWISEDDFLDADMEAHIVRLCRILGLPEDHARTWRAPSRLQDPAPAASDDAAPEPHALPPPPDPDSS